MCSGCWGHQDPAGGPSWSLITPQKSSLQQSLRKQVEKTPGPFPSLPGSRTLPPRPETRQRRPRSQEAAGQLARKGQVERSCRPSQPWVLTATRPSPHSHSLSSNPQSILIIHRARDCREDQGSGLMGTVLPCSTEKLFFKCVTI